MPSEFPGIDRRVVDGEVFQLGNAAVSIGGTGPHRRSHRHYFADDGLAFVGDTLFAQGCGRMFEGTAQQMWGSLQKLWRCRTKPPFTALTNTPRRTRPQWSLWNPATALRQRVDEIARLRGRFFANGPTSIASTRPILSCARKARICSKRLIAWVRTR